jgi:four helix bundle protein
MGKRGIGTEEVRGNGGEKGRAILGGERRKIVAAMGLGLSVFRHEKPSGNTNETVCVGRDQVCHLAELSRPVEVIARQVLKSGTSIGANYREATRAESRSDFIHKLAICEKEAAETEYWLEICAESQLASVARCNPLLEECRELIAIIVASIRTAKSRI